MLQEAVASGAQIQTLLVRAGREDCLAGRPAGRQTPASPAQRCTAAPDALFRHGERGGDPAGRDLFLRAAAVGRGRAGRQRAGAAARRLAGPGQPWHDPAHRRGVCARRRRVVRGLRRPVFAQGRALDHGSGVPPAVRARCRCRTAIARLRRRGPAGVCDRAARGQRAAVRRCRSAARRSSSAARGAASRPRRSRSPTSG